MPKIMAVSVIQGLPPFQRPSMTCSPAHTQHVDERLGCGAGQAAEGAGGREEGGCCGALAGRDSHGLHDCTSLYLGAQDHHGHACACTGVRECASPRGEVDVALTGTAPQEQSRLVMRNRDSTS